jgi:translation initiation factor 2 subunit 1
VRKGGTVSENAPFLPEPGELVVSTVKKIAPYGAYVALDEFNDTEGLLHISEISSRWVKNIRDHVRENQKVVLKVLRVDAAKLHIDLSLRRVNDRERKTKIQQWKQESRGRKLFNMAAEKLGLNTDEAYQKIGVLLETKFDSIYTALEKTVEGGVEVLVKSGVPPDWAEVLTESAKGKIRLPYMRIRGELELTCAKPNGVAVLRDAFRKAKRVRKPKGTNVKIYVVGAPRYRIEVTARSYKEAEQLLKKAVQTAMDAVKSGGGKAEFTRLA